MKKILIFLFVSAVFIAQSSAIEWDLYGKVASGIWWMKSYKFYDDTIPTEIDPVTGDTVEALYGEDPFPVNNSDFITRGTFGIEAKGDRFSGKVEVGMHVNVYDYRANKENELQYYYEKYNDLIFLKKWYLEWYINDYFSLLAGQDIAPTNFFPSNQWFLCGNGFNNVGCLSTGLNPMIQLSAGNQLGVEEPTGFTWKTKLAVVKIDTTNLRIKGKGGEDLNGDSIRYYSEVKIPKIEGSFECSAEKGNFGFEGKLAGGYQRFYQLGIHYSWFEDGAEKYPVDAYVMGADLRVKLGKFEVAVDGFYGQNVGCYGAYIGDAFGWWFSSWYMFTLMPILYLDPDFPDDEDKYRFLNSNIYEVAAILSFTPVDFLVFEGGAGTVQGTHEFDGYNTQWHPTYAWYAHTRFKILEKLEIIPEVGQYIYGPQFDFGKYAYWGLNTFIEF